jgi:hypothetical protein
MVFLVRGSRGIAMLPQPEMPSWEKKVNKKQGPSRFSIKGMLRHARRTEGKDLGRKRGLRGRRAERQWRGSDRGEGGRLRSRGRMVEVEVAQVCRTGD